MKKLRTVKHAFLAVLMLTFYIGCSSDDNGAGAGGANSELVGTWYMLTYNGHEADECERQTNIQVMADGRLILQEYGGTTTCTLITEIPGDYTIDGNVVTIDTNLPMVPLITLTFSISDGILTTEGNNPLSEIYGINTWTKNP